MNLSKFERLLLINQYEILSRLDPENNDIYARNIEILEQGYKAHYSDFVEWMSDDIPEEVTNEALDILNMYRELKFSYLDLDEKEKKKVDEKELKFRGFDGNNEGVYMNYVRFFIHKLDRFDELRDEYEDYNTHMPMLSKYRRMLNVLDSIKDRDDYRRLTVEEINKVLNA